MKARKGKSKNKVSATQDFGTKHDFLNRLGKLATTDTTPCALILIDGDKIGNLKQINGQRARDALLWIRQCIKTTCTIENDYISNFDSIKKYHLGSDDFAIILTFRFN